MRFVVGISNVLRDAFFRSFGVCIGIAREGVKDLDQDHQGDICLITAEPKPSWHVSKACFSMALAKGSRMAQ